ncbi:NlpC/P60 family protein [Streptomyces sp. NPDC057654]|uniref:C40 family peptidase n=1 Tax=Streptomyces sp. NPDC057654 TaxID=3346196 RepID=UPI0036A23900
MASHRKPRRTGYGPLDTPTRRRTAVGLTTAALASATLLSQTAHAAPGRPTAPKPSVEEVQRHVDALYRQAGTATQEYNAAKERTDAQSGKVDRLLDDVAKRTGKLNDARRALGAYAAAQYRDGGMSQTANLLFASDPQSWFDQTHLIDRMTGRQEQAVREFRTQQKTAAKDRGEAVRNLAALTDSQKQLRAKKETVQGKLGEARELLSKLTAQEKARLAEIERKKEAAAKKKAEELAKRQAEKRKQEEAAKKKEQGSGSGSGSGSESGHKGDGSDSGAPSGSHSGTHSAKADKAIAFARAQMGKPYVWGATGPNSYDCSGLTQAAWKAAGVDLPRTTWDQVKTGTRVATDDLQPGDLVFFYDDISHVGMYIGDGKMIHAPKPGASVRVESIFYMPIYGSVRPA